jgi:hypothetical protein
MERPSGRARQSTVRTQGSGDQDAPPVGAPPLGIVAFSFGLRAPDEEPNPANAALAGVVGSAREAAGRSTVIVAQWEVAKQLERDGVPVTHRVIARPDRYLDSTEVWRQARDLLHHHGVRDVVPVAHPILHLRYVTSMLRADGFDVVAPPRHRVPFDRSDANHQWWTRSRIGLAVYALGKRIPVLRACLSPFVGPWPS